MTRNGPTRPDPVAREAIRLSLLWVGGAIVGLLACLFGLPLLAEAVGVPGLAGLGPILALVLGIVCIMNIRSIWRRSL